MIVSRKMEVDRVPLVSVGMPVFNGERHVAEAIRSIVAQEEDDLELIISDNASTDGTEDLCRHFASQDRRIHYYRSQNNRGAAWNYNRAFALARGKYFKWAAHDDVCDASLISRCVSELERNQDAVLGFARTVRIDDGGTTIRFDNHSIVATEAAPVDRARGFLRNPTPCFEVFGVIRRDVLAQTPLIGKYAGSDRVLLFELALRGRFVMIDDYLFRNRDHTERSIRRFENPHERNIWFDPSLRGLRAAPQWRVLGGYTSAIRRSRLSLHDRVLCLGFLGLWSRDHGRQLIRDAGRFVLGVGSVGLEGR